MSLLFYLSGIQPLVVDKIEENRVQVNNGFKYLYGLKIVGNVENVKTLRPETVKKFLSLSSTRYDKILYLVLRKQKAGPYKRHSLYYLSYNRELLNLLKESIGPYGVFMSGPELANVLISLMLQRQDADVDLFDGFLKDYSHVFRQSGEIVRHRFAKMVAEIEEDDYDLYISCGIAGSGIAWERIFRLDWEGALWLFMNFNDPYQGIKRKKDQAIEKRDVLKAMEEGVKQGVRSYVGVSCWVSGRELSKEKATDLLYSLGFLALEKKHSRELYLKSPISVRDDDYTFYVAPEYVGELLIYSFEKNNLPSVADIYGRNRFGSFVAYNLFEENNNPHCLIFAPSGAGKSFGIQNMISQMLRVDVGKLYRNEPQRIREDVRIRHFDKGFSAELFYRLMKERGLSVDLFSARVDEITLNPVEILDDSSDELDFALFTTNACLVALGIEPLLEFEAIWFINALREVYRTSSFALLRKNVYYLANLPAFQDIYRRILHRYSPNESLEVVSRDQEFSFLRVPLLSDVIRAMAEKSEDRLLTERERMSIKNALAKLEALSKEDVLSHPTQINLAESRIMYIDYEYLSGSKFYVPILMTILKRLIQTDKFRKSEKERAFYVIDEAHNLFRNEYFSQALKVLVREARKYRISVIMLTQFFDEVPVETIMNTDTVMLLAPQEEKKRIEYLQSFYNHLSKGASSEKLETGKDLEAVYYAVPAYTFTTWYSQGVFSLSLDVDQYKKELFNSYVREIRTQDNLLIRKSMVVSHG